MKVIDVTNSDIEKACEALMAQFDLSFDLIVGIANGGRLPAEIIAQKLHLPLLLIAQQRKMTSHKNQAKNIFKYIPRKILNGLRIIESRGREFLFYAKKNKTDRRSITVISENLSLLQNPEIKNILLVDDAIDSGQTILNCKNFLLQKNNSRQIKVAVFTQTFKKPLCQADYTLYNRVLLRFPWSNDFKK